MPISAALTFAAALTLTIQFLIFAYLYSSHRVRFFQYLLMAWGFMSLAKGLHLARYIVHGAEIMGALILASVQFWPRGTSPVRYRGTRFLALSLGLWGLHRIVSPFLDPSPGSG